MSATESWQERHARMDRMMLRIEAGLAQRNGIDIFAPGWRDEYLELVRERREESERIDRLIGTPHVEEAVAAMEEQFDVESEVAS